MPVSIPEVTLLRALSAFISCGVKMRWTTGATGALKMITIPTCLLVLTACDGTSGSDGSASATGTTQTGTVQSTNAMALSTSAYSITQNSGSASVTVTRMSGSSGSASVNYASSNQTAVAGTDYTAVNGTLTWSDGDMTAKTINVPVSNATPFAGNKSFTVALSNPGSGAAISTPGTATVTITGDQSVANSAPSGSLEFSAANYSVNESSGEVTVTVDRTGGSAGPISVNYSATNGTAVAGTDYTSTGGTLDWAGGDTTPKTFSVDLNTAQGFSGTKSFTVGLSSPSTGASVGSPGSALVAITGTGSSGGTSTGTGSGPPSAVGNLQLINEGGPNESAPATNIEQISWSAATPGANPISYYRIYRNGSAYATTTSLSYTDKSATASVDPTWSTAATVYSYNVTAVDTQGTEGPKAAQMAVYAYQNGVSAWGNNDLSYGTIVENYSSTGGNPQNGKYDVSVDFVAGGFQPAVHSPQAPLWTLEIGAFNYFTIDINPGPTVTDTLNFGTVTRLPPGDVYGWHPGVNIFNYGPAPVANKWATYKIPLTAIAMGMCQFTGSISGHTLTVTNIVSGQPLVDAGGFVTGPGVPAGTYITAYSQNAAIGTFTIAGAGITNSTNVASTKMTFQRTSLYKFGINTPSANATLYFNNMGFTVN
jgi:hypothetical protein